MFSRLISYLLLSVTLMTAPFSFAWGRHARHRHEHGHEHWLWPEGNGPGTPVWATFMHSLAACAPGCKPIDYNAYRPGHHSCHNFGRAIDVHGFDCGGRVYMAIHGGPFRQIVRCMKHYMVVLYRNGDGVTRGHHDHAHFSIGCSLPGHPHYW